MIKFNEDFVFGAASSGPQSEGNLKKEHENIFDYWYRTEPSEFFDSVGPDSASNFYNDYEADLDLMKKAGIKALRLSIQWSRLIDDFEDVTINDKAAKFYKKVFLAMKKRSITPYVNLFHFDMPIELQQKYGGWQSKHVVHLYARFAKKCFELFGDLIDDWFTFNEPKVILDGQYLYKFHYPNLVNGSAAVQVAYNLNLASAMAIAEFKKSIHSQNAKIGTILNLTPVYAASKREEDQNAAHFAELWANEMFLQPAIQGSFPDELVDILRKDDVLWSSTEDELNLIKNNTIDVLGVNYYHPFRVQAPKVSPDSLQDWMPDIYFREYELPGAVMNVDKGWEIYPRALYDIAINVKERYGNIPWFVSENGMGVSNEERFIQDGIVQDDYRIKFIYDHLVELHKGIEEGSNCYGYFVWTAIDNWSWKNAYRNRYGLIRTNIHNQTKVLKKSGYWYKKLSDFNQLPKINE
jgi:6-phospho-beta-glucosidase